MEKNVTRTLKSEAGRENWHMKRGSLPMQMYGENGQVFTQVNPFTFFGIRFSAQVE